MQIPGEPLPLVDRGHLRSPLEQAGVGYCGRCLVGDDRKTFHMAGVEEPGRCTLCHQKSNRLDADRHRSSNDGSRIRP